MWQGTPGRTGYQGGIFEIIVSQETMSALREAGHLATDLDPSAAARGSLTAAPRAWRP